MNDLDPRIETETDLHIVGVGGHFVRAGDPGIADLWRRFKELDLPFSVPDHLGFQAYGVINPTEDGFDYIAGVQVPPDHEAPELDTIALPHRRYAVFTHEGHVTTLPQTMDRIWREWQPQSGETIAQAPFFERYGPGFDPNTGSGDIEVWIPLED